ncbi:hydroxysqualene dehydroxylase HpnE [Niveispirillum fermenti]|uniref:hydroxysqualene dehydroxylase HpnE n=1 Tax=Niveispirillum fermenti TaxID=1233113 RepID=UPI003A8C52EC
MSLSGVTHVVGAGLSGLACATRLATAGHTVILYEATDHAGGRCRSWHDTLLERIIDNGNHLILGANQECMTYLARIGGAGELLAIDPVALPFQDLADGSAWTLRPGAGRIPFWLADPARRVAGAGPIDHLGVLALALAGPSRTVADMLRADDVITRRLWKPLAVSILNTPWDTASARLLWGVLRRTLLGGSDACRPFIAGPGGLSGALVGPALTVLARSGAAVRFGHRLRAVERAGDGTIAALRFTDGRQVALDRADCVILALPADATGALLPDIPVPDAFHAILNAHFRLGAPVRLPAGMPLVGLVGGVTEWLFARGDVLSATVSAADVHMDRPNDDLARLLWAEAARVLDLPPAPVPPCRIVKERRATFAATPAQNRRRPGPAQGRNLILAGDWTATGLPATIEGAILSGHRAAELAMRRPV